MSGATNPMDAALLLRSAGRTFEDHFRIAISRGASKAEAITKANRIVVLSHGIDMVAEMGISDLATAPPRLSLVRGGK